MFIFGSFLLHGCFGAYLCAGGGEYALNRGERTPVGLRLTPVYPELTPVGLRLTPVYPELTPVGLRLTPVYPELTSVGLRLTPVPSECRIF